VLSNKTYKVISERLGLACKTRHFPHLFNPHEAVGSGSTITFNLDSHPKELWWGSPIQIGGLTFQAIRISIWACKLLLGTSFISGQAYSTNELQLIMTIQLTTRIAAN
jgi:hypothetical protein